jgi:hypothetical protein
VIHVEEWSEGARHREVVARAAQKAHPVEPADERADERRLSDARLTPDKHSPPRPSGGLAERDLEPGKRLVALQELGLRVSLRRFDPPVPP